MENNEKSTNSGSSTVKHKPQWLKWVVLLLSVIGLGVVVWFAVPDVEEPVVPIELDAPFEDDYIDESEVDYVEPETVAENECFNANMMNEDKENIIETCEDAKIIECPEGLEPDEDKTECVEYVDTATEETKVAPLEQLTAEQDKTMRKMVSYLLNLYGNDGYLSDEATYKAVMEQVLAPSYYKNDVFEAKYKELKAFNKRTSDVTFVYSTVDVVSSRKGNNFDVYITGTFIYKEKGKQKSETKNLLLQVQTLPDSVSKISYYEFK